MSDDVECVAKRWGSSIGVIIPNEIVKKEHIVPNGRIRIRFTRIPDAKTIWDIGPLAINESAQTIKDELRKGW